MSSSPNVAILLAVYNGEPYLPEQLESIVSQTHRNWMILASDDGSDDNSRSLLQTFSQQHPLILLEGPRQGAAQNFLFLLRRLQENYSNVQWISFCDQDDIWLPEKLERGLAALSEVPESVPALYCSRTWISDSASRPLRLSRPRPRPLSFCNALVQNVCSGNTILLNPAAATLALAAAEEANELVVHDWWLYQIITGAGGQVIHDDAPMLLYRQHTSNGIGANDTFFAQYKRLRQIYRGEFRKWNTINIAALNASIHRLTKENQERLIAFAELRDARLVKRILGLARLQLYRQTRASTIALWLSAALRRL
jgi:glycosyltransferase involved in cell wall biosynthesis